jgi:uncharacterized repeat protein (TIGR01451 family)
LPKLKLPRGLLSLLCVAALADAGAVRAVADGDAPSQVVSESVFGRARAVGNTLMEHDGTVNFALTPGGSAATIPSSEIPPDGTVVRAFLMWSGSVDPLFGVDRDVDFTLADGTFFNDLSVDTTEPGEPASSLNRCISRDGVGDTPVEFFSCRREVTWLLQQQGIGSANGTYRVDDVDALAGDCNNDVFCQAMYGGWALVVMWESPTHPVRRDLVLYDAFFAVDEQDDPFSSGISQSFLLDGFLAGPTADAQIAFMAFEGDAQLGVPPQNFFPPGNPLFCDTCDDFIDLRRPGGARIRLQDANNQPGNLFNGSNNSGGGPHPGLDIDTFDIGPSGLGVLQPGDASLQMRIGSGDGAPGGGGGNGELVFLGFTLLSIETFSPRFSNAGTEKVVLQAVAGVGETLNYLLRIENDGSAAATQTRVRDALPAGVSYVAGSTTNTCGVSSSDVAGTSPVLRAQGLNVGTLDVGERCEVRFEVTIDSGVADGTTLNNFFDVWSAELSPLTVGPATTVVEAAQLGQPTKTVVVAGGGVPSPGSSLLYTIRVPNDGGRVAPGVRIQDTLPSELIFQSFVALPPGSTNNSDTANGVIDVDDISIGANSFAEVSFLATIAPTTPTGTSITNQGTVTQPSLPAPLQTDDPAVGGASDPTTIVVQSDIDLTSSTKSVTDQNGAPTAPGDVLVYAIQIRNTGTSNTPVVVDDDLPPFVGGCQILNLPPGAFGGCQPGGANGTGAVQAVVPVPAGATRNLVFQVTVDAGAPDGATIVNAATLTPVADSTQAVTVTSPTVEVFARPLLATSAKSVVDNNGGDPRPGDTVRYTITITNTGTVPATNVVVSDPVPAGLTNAVPEDGGTLAGGTITWTGGPLNVNASVDVHFTAVIAAGVANGTVITNRATISADAPAAPVTVTAAFTVVAEPLLSATKIVLDGNGAPFEPGDTVRYEITLRNDGDGAATDVVVRDPVDTDLTNVVLPGGGRLQGGDVVFDGTSHPELVAFAPGDSITLVFEADIITPLADGTLVNNQAGITAVEVGTPVVSDDPTTPGPPDSTDFIVESQAELALTKTFLDLDGGALLPGDRVEFVITVSNTGNAPATGVEVRDPLDSRLTFVASSTGGQLVGNDVVFTSAGAPGLSNVLPGAPVELRFTADIDFPLADGTLIPNQATGSSPDAAAADSDDPTTPAPLDPTVLLVESRPILEDLAKVVTDLDGDGVFEPGDRVRYQITVSNTGSEPAANVVITDDVPALLTNAAAQNGGVVAGGTITWTLGAVAVGANVAVSFEADVVRPIDNGATILNQAKLAADGISEDSDDPATPAPDDPTAFTVVSHPLLVVEKTVVDGNGAPPEPGDLLTYTITARNDGGRSAVDVTITDVVDSNLTSLAALDGGAVAGNTITWSGGALADVAVDETVTVRFTARIVLPLENGTLIENQASASLAEPGVPNAPFPSDDPTTPLPLDPTVVQVVSASDLTASTLESFDESLAVIDTARPGDTVVYRFVVRNAGNESARNVSVTIPLPAELTITSAPGGNVVGAELRYGPGGVPGFGTLDPGGDVTLTFQGLLAFPIDDGTPVSLHASIDEDGLVAPVPSDDPSTGPIGDATIITIESAPDLTGFEKRFVDLNGAPVEPGDEIDYVLRVANTGDARARDVVVRDPLPADVEFVSSPDGGRVVGGAVVFDTVSTPALAALDPGLLDLTFRVRVRDDVVANTTVDNQATVIAQGLAAEPSDDPTTNAPNDQTSFTVVTVPRATVSKDLTTVTGTRIVAPEEPLTYTFVITSSGTGTVTGASFLDIVPAQLANIVPGAGLSFDGGSRRLTANLAPLPPGESATFTLQAIVAPGTPNGTSITNQALVSGPTIETVRSDDPLPPGTDDPTTALVEAFADLSATTKTATDLDGAPLLPGDTIRYEITVDNQGNGAALNASVSDELHPRLAVAAVGQGGAVAGQVVRWDASTTPALASIAPRTSVTLTIDATVLAGTDDGTVISNQAFVDALDVEQEPTDDPGTAVTNDPTVVVVRSPRLTFEKRVLDVDGAPLRPGDDVRYELRVVNSGSAAATDVRVEDADLPSQPLLDVTPGQGGAEVGGSVLWTSATTGALASLDPGQTVVLTVDARVDPLATGGTLVTNQAQLSASELAVPLESDDPATNVLNDATQVVVEASEEYPGTVELFDAETGAPIAAPVVPEQRVRARISFSNEGTQTGQGAVLRVPFDPLRFDLEEADTSGVIDRAANEARWDASLNDAFRQFAPGEGFVVEVVGRVASQIPDASTIGVQGELTTISSGQTFIIGPATMTVESRPDLAATTKEVEDVNGGNVEPGDVLRWRITVINAGGAAGVDVRVVDQLPAGTVYVPGSTTVAGAGVADSGALPTSAGLPVGDLGAGRSIVVTFETRVALQALHGFVISNHAVLRAEGVPDEVSDDPRTPLIVGDATTAVVGGGPRLVVAKVAGPVPAQRGELLHYDVAIENAGNALADGVSLSDALAAPVGAYVPGSITVDGTSATDLQDGDEAWIDTVNGAPVLRFERAVLEAGDGVLVGFDVTVPDDATVLTNQALVSSSAGEVLSDGDPTLPGAQPTVVPVADTNAVIAEGATLLEDANGGLLLAADPVRGRTVIRNGGTTAVQLSNLLLQVSGLLDLDPSLLGPGLEFDAASRTIRFSAGGQPLVGPGDSVTLSFGGTVDEQAEEGDFLRVTGSVTARSEEGGLSREVELSDGELTVGLLAGTGALIGTVFFEGEERNGEWDAPGTDVAAQGFTVLAFAAGADEPTRTAVSDENGTYRLLPLPAGNYRLEVRSGSGALFATHSANVRATAQEAFEERDLLIDPSGAVYNGATFDTVRGARAVLYLDDGDGDVDNDARVPDDQLPLGQQGQLTTLQGLYRFDAPPGDYRIGIEPPDALMVWPSSSIEPQRTTGQSHPLGDVAAPAPNGDVVPHALPDAALDRTYFLRFHLDEDAPPVLHNHIPVDRLRDQVRITKTANRRRLSIGDLVAYTVRVENRSAGELSLDEGGVEIVDTLPEAFRLVPDSWMLERLEVDDSGQQRRFREATASAEGRRIVRFGPFALGAGTTYELRYQVVVGPGAPRGDADNRALLRTAQGQVPLSDVANARVRVQADALFDLGSIRAKVYCDDDADGWQDPGEIGLPGARVYLDTGHYAEADVTGKAHFSLVPPGMHLAKLDPATLPPGTRPVGSERRSVYLSAGLPAQISFGARCRFTPVGADEVEVNAAAYQVGDEVAGASQNLRRVKVEGFLPSGRVFLDGVEMSTVRVDLGVGTERVDPRFAQAPGPNLPSLAGDVLAERLSFVPRVEAGQRVLGWQLTVQRDVAPPPATAAPASSAPDAGPQAAAEDAGPAGAGSTDAGVSSPDASVAALAAVVEAEEPPAGETVYVFSGEGMPPRRIDWDGRDPSDGSLVLEEGQRYSAVLAVVAEGGDEGFSPARPFALAFGEPEEGDAPTGESVEVELDARAGTLFKKTGAPTRRLEKWLGSHAERLAAGPGRVFVHVHVDARPDEPTAALTAQRAQALAALLVKAGVPEERIEAVGEGDTKPVRPNLRDRDRKANRRVQLRLVVEPQQWPDVEAVWWPGRATVASAAVDIAKDVPAFSHEVEVELGSVLVVDQRAPGGGRVRVMRQVAEGPFAASGDTGPVAASVARLEGDLTARTLRMGEREVSLALLGVDVTGEAVAADGALQVPVPTAGALVELTPVVPAEREWVKWRLRVMRREDAPAPSPAAAAPRPEARSAVANPWSDAGPAPETPSTSAAPSRSGVAQPWERLTDAGAPPEVDAGAVAAPAPTTSAPAAPTPPPGTPDAGAPAQRAGAVLHEIVGEGAPPERVEWDGSDSAGKPVLEEGGRYYVRLIVEAADGDIAISRDVPVLASSAPPASVADGIGGGEVLERVQLKDPARASGALKRAARAEVNKLGKRLASVEGAVVIEAHTDDRGARLTRRTRTQRTADEVRKLLVKAGVDEQRVRALGMGSDSPKMPPLGERARRANRRVEIRLEGPPKVAAPAATGTPRIVANGRTLAVDGDRFAGDVPASRTGEVSILIRSATGSRAMVRLRPEHGELWQGRPAALADHVAAVVARAGAPEAPAPETFLPPSVAPVSPDGGPPPDAAVAVAPAVDAGPATDAGGGAAAAVARAPYTGEGVPPSWWPTLDRVPAADLEVQLPDTDEKFRSRNVLVRGRTAPGNRVRVLGQDVPVDPATGEFAHVAELPRGDSELLVESEDSMGNKARVRRLINVDETGWFALLLADTAVGGDGARLAERTAFNSLKLGDFFVYGRGVAYVKGRFTGPWLFRDYDLTLHLDTSRWDDEAWARDLRNPDLVYPVWGDSSVEVQEARARFPLYAELKADASSLLIGNVRPDLTGGDLFRYNRARYGALLSFDRGWTTPLDVADVERALPAPAADPWRTRVKTFFTGGDTRERHARVEMQGTGGGVYFLRHELVVEGSERVNLIVRDAVTGGVIARRALARNVDYTMRYAEGRLLMVEPVPAFTDALFMVNHNLGQVNAGHRVFVEVDYDHKDVEPFMGLAGGGHVTQTMLNHFELGGGYLLEGRDDGVPGYQLGGVHARAFLDDVTWIRGEWAWSKNVDAGNFLSNDGGLTYQPLGQSLDQGPARIGRVVFPAEREGQAFGLEGQLGFGHWLGRSARDGLVKAYVKRQSPGFFAGSNIVEQGQLKWGGDGAWRITDDDALRLRYDGVIADIPEIPHVTETRTLNRQIATLGYERRILTGLKAGVEYGYGYTYDSASFGQSTFAQPREVHTNVAAGSVDWRVLERLTLGAKQEVILSGDTNQLQAWPDHLVTHLSARWAITEELALTGTESLRWSGENRTSLGVSWKVNDEARVYANERFGFARGGWTNTTVVGGETEMAPGSKAYAEYQLESAFSRNQSRGVMGLRNRWKLPYGFALSFGYERTQVFGGAVTTTETGNVPPGAFTDGTFYAAPGANGGGNFFYGAGSRDALSVGAEYKLPGWVIASQRLELRYDDFAEDRGGRDLLWLMNMTNAEVRVGPELALLARYNVGLAQNLSFARDNSAPEVASREAYLEHGMLGASFRPVRHDWFSALFKLSRKVDARPIALKEGRFEEYTIHAAAIEPIVELPWKLQFVEKLALKHAHQVIDDLPAADAVTVLWINRLNWHALGTFRSLDIDPLIPGEIDLGIEYRMLAGITAARFEHGFLVEAQYAPIDYFRVGVGWNFTHFSDDELARDDRDYSGFFLRGVGQF